MEGVKGLLQSKTFWGAVVGIVAHGLAAAHINVSTADQTELVNIILNAVGVAGDLFAIYGRAVATKKIG